MSAILRPFSTLLVANRGEIALRVMKTARRMGLATIAVYSDADAGAPHVRFADCAMRIGPAPARESYLSIPAILAAARESGAEAVHPGYGFLSERAEFADALAEAGLVFVGPPAKAIRAMGLKDAAKALVEKAGVPVVPGYHGANQDGDFLRGEAERIGFPVLIKAVAGGGGKGMRKVEAAGDFGAALASAQREAEAAFGDPRVLVEKFVQAPRHVEVQVFGDSHGRVVSLFERDCSSQRRHQKVIEEAPAPGMPEKVRAAMGKAAVAAAEAVGYVGAGTVEFIADGANGLSETGFFFMEMNTRLQVEHPVTEAITGVDLVEWQLRVAMGEPLPAMADRLAISGHAVEARVYAEDPEHGFLPSTGALLALEFPQGEGLRVDCGVEAGGAVSPFYDPMIAKVIAHGATRDDALDRLSAALKATKIAGPKTNLAFLKALVDHPEFRAGLVDTGLIDRNLAALGAVPQTIDAGALEAAAGHFHTLALADRAKRAALSDFPADPWHATDGFSLAGAIVPRLRLAVAGEARDVAVRAEFQPDDVALVPAHGSAARQAVHVLRAGRQTIVEQVDPLAVDIEHLGEAGDAILSPMHGKVVAMAVTVGARVEKGQRLAVVEAMKMEHALVASRAGIVAEVRAKTGDQVAERAVLIVLAEAADEGRAA